MGIFFVLVVCAFAALLTICFFDVGRTASDAIGWGVFWWLLFSVCSLVVLYNKEVMSVETMFYGFNWIANEEFWSWATRPVGEQ